MRRLSVLLHGERVGELERDKSGKVTFHIDEEWRSRPGRPVLSASFEVLDGRISRRQMVAGTGLPPYFENLLPERDSRAFLAGINGVRSSDGFGILEATGRNLFGAVQVVGDVPPSTAAHGIEHVSDRPGVVEADFSLAGVQRKLLLSRVSDRITATTDSHIIKIPDMVNAGLVRNEFAIMRLAKAAGFDVADVEIARIDFPRSDPLFADMPESMDVLAVARFDRLPDGTRIHAEEVAQMFGTMRPENKYEYSSEAIALRLADSGIDPRRLLEQLVFHAVVGNGDSHAKNFAVVYPDRVTPRLAPMYDAVSTVVYGKDDTFAVGIGGRRKWRDLDATAFCTFGERFGIDVPETRRILTDVIDRTLGAWGEVRDLFPEHLVPRLEQHFQRGLAVSRDHILNEGMPRPLSRIPTFPTETHSVARSGILTVVRRNEDKKVDNPIDAAIVRRDGGEVYVLGGAVVPENDVLGTQAPGHRP